MKEVLEKVPDASSDPGRPEVLAQLDRILAATHFQRSRRLSNLLRYLVTETLEGRGDRIKATAIAVDLYDRDENFDPQSDTIVRVEAGRLRRRLEEYYRDSGRADPVLIDIPKGAYRPYFTRIGPGNPASSPGIESVPESGKRSALDRKILYLTAAIATITLLISTWTLLQPQAPSNTGDRVIMSAAHVAKPYVVVMPFRDLSGDGGNSQLASGVVESLITNLAKLSGLSVMAHASSIDMEPSDEADRVSALRDRFGITHLVHGSVARNGGSTLLQVQLIDAASRKILWADRLSHTGSSILNVEEELALRIADVLSVQIQPAERERLADNHAANPEALVLYRQGLVMLIPPNDATRINTARELFRHTQELDPAFAGGYAGESFSHSITLLFLKANEPAKELALALPLAEKAIALDPAFGMAYATLAFAQIFSSEHEKALDNARRAVAIQPGDAFAQFILGMSLVIAGQPRQGLSALKEALRLDPLESRTPYLNVLAIAYYAAGDFSRSLQTLEYNEDRGGPRGPHMDVFRVAALARLGREEEARQLLQVLGDSYPDFPVRKWLTNWLQRGDQLHASLGALEQLAPGQ